MAVLLFVQEAPDGTMKTNCDTSTALKLDSNPEFTSSVIVAYARAAHRIVRKDRKAAKPFLMLHRHI